MQNKEFLSPTDEALTSVDEEVCVVPVLSQGEIHPDGDDQLKLKDASKLEKETLCSDSALSEPPILAEEGVDFESQMKTCVRHSIQNHCHGSPGRDAVISVSQKDFQESSLLGFLSGSASQHLFLNIHNPFCAVVVGTQGKGKSHTTNSILEGCLFEGSDEFRIMNKMSAVVLHFDSSTESLCESVGVGSYSSYFTKSDQKFCDVKVFVSGSNPKRKKQYKDKGFEVLPLKFQWSQLTANHLKKLMKFNNNDNTLYMNSMFSLLREIEAREKAVTMKEFKVLAIAACTSHSAQNALDERMKFLWSIVSEDSGFTIKDFCKPGVLVIFDLSDQYLSESDVAGIFEVLVDMYRSLSTVQLPAKLLVLDEAHKYMDTDSSSTNLARALVDVARNMRHDGMRLLISTQNPCVLRPELLELSSVVFLHSFHSKDWFDFLSAKLALGTKEHQEAIFREIVKLRCGEAFVFASNHNVDKANADSSTIKLLVRNRITKDLGETKRNSNVLPAVVAV
jgi:hypothetical protein